MKRLTDQQCANSYHFISWMYSEYGQDVVESFRRQCKPEWVGLPRWRMLTSGMTRSWLTLQEGWDFWNDLDDAWQEHLTYCRGSQPDEVIPDKHKMPNGGIEVVRGMLDLLEPLIEAGTPIVDIDDPDITPDRVQCVTDAKGVELGTVKNGTGASYVFMLWLTYNGGLDALREFLDFADEDWAESDDIDLITLALDWASTPMGVKGWRKLNNQWQVYLLDNAELSVEDRSSSLYFLTWLRTNHGEEYVTDFLDCSFEGWEAYPPASYVLDGMDDWDKTKLDIDNWLTVNKCWKKTQDE